MRASGKSRSGGVDCIFLLKRSSYSDAWKDCELLLLAAIYRLERLAEDRGRKSLKRRIDLSGIATGIDKIAVTQQLWAIVPLPQQ